MGDLIVPLLVVVIAALAVIGIFIISRYPVSTWRAGLRDLTKAARDKEGPVEVVPQDVHLDDLMTRDDSSAYTRTDAFPGLVGAVEKAMRAGEADCSCEEVARHLFELLDAQMPEEMAARLRRHCETCPHCSDLASAEAHIRHILRRSCCGEPAPATLRVRITSQIAVYRRTTA